MLKSGSYPKPKPCYVPSLANSVEIHAVQLVKQGMEADGFRAVQSSVQPLLSTVVGLADYFGVSLVSRESC